MEKVNVLLFDAKTRNFKQVMCETLDDYYEYLDCRCFDIATRKVGQTYYDIYCDDEGLLKADPILSAINHDGEPMLVGNLIFALHNAEGETVGLTETNIAEIIDNSVMAILYNGDKIRLVMCEY